MKVELRDYQRKGIRDILLSFLDIKSVLFQMPTGTGKTTLFCEIVKQYTHEYPEKKVLIVTHRRELVKQVVQRLANFNLASGIIASQFLNIETMQIQVASIQTLIRRTEHQKDEYSLIVIDEAHHALATTYKQLWNFYPTSKFLGVTATPIRTTGEGFQDLFEKLIVSETIKWFIRKKYLADIKYFATHTPDLSNIRIDKGDYVPEELSEVMQDNKIIADLIQSYNEYASGKKIIVFAVNRAHSIKIVEKYNESGLEAKYIDSFTPYDERNQIVNDFRNNKFKILCNVNIFTEGFDCPDVDAVQLARPTKSLTLYLQQVGRCMRYHDLKEFGIILDNAGLWKEHGLPKMERKWSLTGIDEDFCPTKKNIVGIKHNLSTLDNCPIESTSLRLVEIDELEEIEDVISPTTISYHEIEKSLIDKNILTMNDKIKQLLDEIDVLEKAKENQGEIVKDALDKSIAEKRSILDEMKISMQPFRIEQVYELISSTCQEIIDNNEIFIDGDKEIFLSKFVPPKLVEENKLSKAIKSIRTNNQPHSAPDGFIEIYHHFRDSGTEIAYFNPTTQKFYYEGEYYPNPHKPSKMAKHKHGRRGSTVNGWDLWFYDDNGVRKTVKNLKK